MEIRTVIMVLAVELYYTGLLVRLQFFDTDIAKHDEAGLVVELQPDRSPLRSARIAGVLRNRKAVQLHADHVVARFDIERVPVVIDLSPRLGGVEQVHAARRVSIGMPIQNLDRV